MSTDHNELPIKQNTNAHVTTWGSRDHGQPNVAKQQDEINGGVVCNGVKVQAKAAATVDIPETDALVVDYADLSVASNDLCVHQVTDKNNGQQGARFQLGDFTAGFIAGIAGVVVGHPFDTIKVRQQVKGAEYQSLVKCMTRTFKHEGVPGFYKGLLFPLITEGGRNCVFFGVYERLKIAEERGKPVHYGNIAMAGALGGAVHAVIGTPVELVKIKLQGQTEKQKQQRHFRGPIHCLHSIHSRFGLLACFRGLTPCILRDISGFATYMTSYEYLCRQFHPEGPGHCPVSVLLLTGGIAGALSWATNLPMDYIKSRIQADSMSRPRYVSGMRGVLKEVWGGEGVRVFYRGLPAVLMRAFVLNAVTLCVYSSSRSYFMKYNSGDVIESISSYGKAAPKIVPID